MAAKRKAANGVGRSPPNRGAGGAVAVHTWKQRPDAPAVLEHVLAFTDALARVDLDEAFRLCPVLERK